VTVRLTFRASTIHDHEAIAALCSRVLYAPTGSPLLSAEHMQWKYWTPWPAWEGSRSFVLADGKSIVAHAAVVPSTFSRGGQRYRLLQLLDWAALPERIGAGVSLLKRIAQLENGLLNVRGSESTQRILRPLGFRSLGLTTRYVRVLRSVPGVPAQRPAASEDHRAAREGFTLKRFSSPPLRDAAPHPKRAVESDDRHVILQRSLAEIELHLRCPSAPMRYLELWRQEELLGTALCCKTPGQQRLVDAWVLAPAVWEPLISAVIEEARRDPDALEVVTQCNDPTEQRALLDAGFITSGSDPLDVLCDPELIPNGAVLWHQLIDSDLAYLHHGVTESWSAEALEPGR
jgi:hypothetical protein